MKLTTPSEPIRREYRQTARAAAAEANAVRIVEAFRARLERQWFDEIRLEDVAQDAGVTVQTIIRRFAGKEGLLKATSDQTAVEVMTTRGLPVGDPAAVVRAIVADYEHVGDYIMRILAQEDRYPALRQQGDRGRVEHRGWIAAVFAPWLEGLEPEAARRRTDALVIATDLYVWKLVRRDMGRSVEAFQDVMRRLVDDALKT